MRWAEGGSCRHDAILRYFGDEEETLAGCGRCDVCLDLASNTTADPELVSATVRKALCAVARVHGRFGLQVAAKLLRGDTDQRLRRAHLDQSPTFGTLNQYSEQWLLQLLRRCVTAGWVDFQGGDRPVVVITEQGLATIHAEHPVNLLLPPSKVPGPRPQTTRPISTPNTLATDDLDRDGKTLFEALRRHRLELARTEGVPPYVIASDRARCDIALLRHPNPTGKHSTRCRPGCSALPAAGKR